MMTFNYIASFFLIVLGFYTIITKYNLIKTVIGLGIADYGVNLLIISIGYNGGTAPIFTEGEITAVSLCRPHPSGADPDEHRHRRVRHGDVPRAGHQA